MRLRTITIRLVALIVLLASATDYWAYDRVDATAPMNSPAGEVLTYAIQSSDLTASFHPTDSPDDHCLWCSPWVAVVPPVLPRAHPSFFAVEAIPVFIPSHDPGPIEQPPEISLWVANS